MALVIPLWVLWLTLAVGAPLAARYVVAAFRREINTDALIPEMRRLLEARQLDRALKLCGAYPRTPHLVALRSAIEVCVKGVTQGEAHTGYRDAPVLTSERVLAPVREAFELSFDAIARPLITARIAAAIALVPLALTVGAGFLTPGGATPAALASLATLLLVRMAFADRRIHRERASLFDALAPQLEALARTPGEGLSKSASPGVRVQREIAENNQPMRELEVNSSVLKIGCGATADVRLEGPGVARMHAIIEREGDRVHIIDLGGVRRTRVNGAEVNKCALNEGDLITIGDVTLRVHIGGQ